MSDFHTPDAPDPADVYAEAPREPGARRPLLVAGVLLALVVLVGIAWAVTRDEPAHADHTITETPSPTEDDAVPAVGGLAQFDLNGDGIVYQESMHPHIVQDEPGVCPICGMDFEPVQVSGAPAGTVEIDPVTLQNIGVRTATVTSRELERELRTTGTFEARDSGRETVTLRVGGFVERLYVDTEGQRVRQGQPLLEIYSPELVSTQQELLLAVRNRELLGGGDGADRLVEAARTRLRLFGLGAQQIAAVERSGAIQERITLFAPASGTVQNKRIIEGMQATPGMPLMDIVNLGALYLQVAVPEQDLGWVARGTRAVVTLPSQPGEELRGRVDLVYDTLDPMTRTGTARVTLANAGGRLRPGMYATARLFGAASASGPVVPSEAVVRTGDEAAVIVALGEGRFRPQPVRLGEESGGFVQILEGVAVGDRVVTSAQFLIDSEARLAASLGAMAPMPGMDMDTGDAR
ncbi:efflux RND transporter periplasmic adaptor subunit [Rubrivirga sp. IMCC43871]|uniref:efflux RND transporter periplasmic adaptor subunit n=1 Tax=Rubrivirga sp. IMCC43871 TaxID=3391575 RepID=UPI00398FDECF